MSGFSGGSHAPGEDGGEGRHGRPGAPPRRGSQTCTARRREEFRAYRRRLAGIHHRATFTSLLRASICAPSSFGPTPAISSVQYSSVSG